MLSTKISDSSFNYYIFHRFAVCAGKVYTRASNLSLKQIDTQLSNRTFPSI